MARRICAIVLALALFGLIMLSSASVVDAQKKFGSSTYYVMHQLLYGLIPGCILLFLLWRMDYHWWRRMSFFILLGSFALMVLVFLPQFGVRLKGATSWVNLFGFSFQPAEFLKLGLVTYLAAWFGGRHERIRNWQFGVLPFLFVLACVSALLILQPDVGTLGLVILIAMGMYFIAGARLRQFAILAGIGVLVIGILVAIAPYRLDRIKTVLNPSADTRGASYQVNQALIAIGSGGVWGVGYGKSTQKFGFLPEAIGDSIFAVIAEELGFVGAASLILLFMALCGHLILVARRAPDKFGQLFTSGMALWIFVQAFVNIAAIVGIAPLTGVPLPLVSYGGTSMISVLAGLGVALSIAERT